MFRTRVPAEDADVVRRLKTSGAIILGKLNLHEFAMGCTGDVSYFGPCRNPWALDRVTGGSSSGSGAAVAADLCYAALGTDTGGSIRVPSSWCGIVGIKPTTGLVSIRGIIPCAASLDHCGPMARTVEDVALMLTEMTGYDNLDIFSVEHPREDYIKVHEAARLGLPARRPGRVLRPSRSRNRCRSERRRATFSPNSPRASPRTPRCLTCRRGKTSSPAWATPPPTTKPLIKESGMAYMPPTADRHEVHHQSLHRG